MAYPTAKSNAELNEKMLGKIIDGYVNELKHYVKRKGLTDFGTQGSAKWDGIYRTKSLPTTAVLGVTNGTVYRINSGGTFTAYTGDTLTVGTVPHFTEDGTNVFIAHGGAIAKVDTVALTVDLMTGGNAPTGVTFVAYLDSFLVCDGEIGGGGVPGDLNFSDDKDNDYEASDSWEVFNNEALGDSCTAVAVQWQEIYCFGPESMEASYNDGESPFARIDGGISPYGIVAPNSLLNCDNTLYFLSRVDGAIRLMRIEGRRPVVASEAYDRQLQALTHPEDGRAFLIVDDGKPFYCVSFIQDDITLAFNLRTRQWSQFALWSGTSATGTLTSNGTAPANGATVTIGSYTYTFVTALSSPAVAGEVLIGASAAVALDNLKSAVNGTAGAGTTYGDGTLTNDEATAGANTDTTQAFTSAYSGLFGNSIATTETSSTLSFGAATLTGGTEAYNAFAGQCSEFWVEQNKLLVGDRRANGKMYSYAGTLDGSSAIRMQLDSNVHQKGSLHKKFEGTLVFDQVGSSRIRFREPVTASTFDEFFYAVPDGYSNVIGLGQYISRQYQVVHEASEVFILMAAEEWFEVGAH